MKLRKTNRSLGPSLEAVLLVVVISLTALFFVNLLVSMCRGVN